MASHSTPQNKSYDNSADLVAFGRGFLANSDFVGRIEKSFPLNHADLNTLYAPGEEGYTDYPIILQNNESDSI